MSQCNLSRGNFHKLSRILLAPSTTVLYCLFWRDQLVNVFYLHHIIAIQPHIFYKLTNHEIMQVLYTKCSMNDTHISVMIHCRPLMRSMRHGNSLIITAHHNDNSNKSKLYSNVFILERITLSVNDLHAFLSL